MKDILKEKRRERFLQKEKHLKKQVDIIKSINYYYDASTILEQPHRFHKMHATNCGNPNCAMCGNPRKMYKQKTIQELKHELDDILEY